MSAWLAFGIALLPADAFALPDRVAAELDEAASTDITRIVADSDWSIAAVIAGSSVRVLDLQSWEVDLNTPCTDPADLALRSDTSTSTLHILVGCTSGEVAELLVDSDRDVASGSSADLGLGEVKGVAYVNDVPWAIVDGESALEGYELDADTLETATDGLSGAFGRSGFVRSTGLSTGSDGYLLVLHGNDEISRMQTSTASAVISTENLASRDWADVVTWGTSGVYLADEGQGGIIRYSLSGGQNNDFSILLDSTDGLAQVTALELDVAGAWLAAADASAGAVWFYDFGGDNLTVGDELLQEIDLSTWGAVSDMAAVDGYLLAGTEGGDVLVLTENPWVEITDAPTASVSDGDTVSLTFTTDLGGDYTVTVGDNSAAAGEGSVDDDGTETVDLQVDDTWSEGVNRLYVEVDDGGLTGHDAVDVTVDNPPPQAEISDVAVGDGKLIVTVAATGISDIASVDLYITTVEFTADDHESGGPDYEGDDTDITSPVNTTVSDVDLDVEVEITGLTNDVTYYVAARVIDDAGTEGSMSDVWSAAPSETCRASECSKWPTGIGCASTGGGTFALALLGLGAMLTRRRWAVGLGLLLVSPLAHAEDDLRVKGHRDDEGKQRIDRTAEVRVGGVLIEDSSFQTAYGASGHRTLDLEAGIQLWRVLEFDAGLGLIRKSGSELAISTLDATGEDTKLTALPLSLSGTLRLDFFDGQPIVPFAGAGIDWWLWRERTGTPTVDTLFEMDAEGGDFLGYHYTLGGNILLDWLQKDRASLARARWGIHDTYLTVEWSRNEMLEDYTAFTGRTVTVGVKIDY
ncbi:MAG: hypothetical protein H6739_34135 [Alphaproteobacteria bacterium]|nr:hypothetical protein [Alphaproteobacteria bacterium]